MCIIFCRHVNQANIELVEDWPLDLFYRRWDALMRVLQKENDEVGG